MNCGYKGSQKYNCADTRITTWITSSRKWKLQGNSDNGRAAIWSQGTSCSSIVTLGPRRAQGFFIISLMEDMSCLELKMWRTLPPQEMFNKEKQNSKGNKDYQDFSVAYYCLSIARLWGISASRTESISCTVLIQCDTSMKNILAVKLPSDYLKWVHPCAFGLKYHTL